MWSMIQCIFIIIICMVLFYIFGQNMNAIFKVQNSTVATATVGFFVYYSLFQIIALPCIFLKASLSFLTLLWGIVILGMIVLFVITTVVPVVAKKKNCYVLKKMSQKFSWFWIVAFALILLQCYVAAASSFWGWDTAYYIGTVNTSLYTDTMYLFNGTSGLRENTLNLRYVLSSFYMNSAVWCRMFHIEALLLQRYVMAVICQLITDAVVLLIGKTLWQSSRKQVILLCAYILFNFFFVTSYSSAGFLLERACEAKAFCANALVLAVFYAVLQLYKDVNKTYNWRVLFIIAFSSIPISMSAILIIPILIFVLLCTLYYEKRSFKIIKYGMICLIPNFIYILTYFLYTKDILVIEV